MADTHKERIIVEVWSNNITQSPLRSISIEALVDGKVVINAKLDKSGLRALHCEMVTSLALAKLYALAYQAVVDKAVEIQDNWEMIEADETKSRKDKKH
jgi:hypothetical protein